MNRYRSHADLGGQRGHGRITMEAEGERFHAPWEPRALALVLAMGATGAWNIDMSRSARETLPAYLRLSYYEIWFEALCKLLAERGLVTPGEATTGRVTRPAPVLPRKLMAADVRGALAKGSSTLRPASTPPQFAVGQTVRTHAGEVPHHTRLPRYARGKRGVIAHVYGVHVFADANALGLGEDPRWLYTVAFDGRELWPDAGDASEAAGLTVSIDAWEPYLSAA